MEEHLAQLNRRYVRDPMDDNNDNDDDVIIISDIARMVSVISQCKKSLTSCPPDTKRRLSGANSTVLTMCECTNV